MGGYCVTVPRMRVRARNAAIVAGLIAGVYLAAVFTVRRVPDRLVAWLGGPTGIARDGGLAVRYRPPAGFDTARLEYGLAQRGGAVRRDGEWLAIDLIGVSEADAGNVAAILANGGLEFREVIDDISLLRYAKPGPGHEDFVAPGVRAELDQWQPEDVPGRRSSSFLVADRISDLEAAFARLTAEGWRPPPHSIIAYERIPRSRGGKRGREEWRSYFVGDRALLDGDAVANATQSQDPDIGRPLVLLDFTREGGQQFAEITTRLAGGKLATMVGGVVKSAPVLNGPIRGGRASITMGGGDVIAQEREAAALVGVLKVGALPPGGVVEGRTWVAPAAIDNLLVLARLLIGLVGGALVGLGFGAVVRAARPSWQPRPPRRAGRFPIKRVAVTLLAPVALLGLGQLALPGVDEIELYHVLARGGAAGGIDLSPVALGLSPVVTAFLVIEVATLLVPRWRQARLRPAARIAIGRYVALLGVVLALLQGHIMYNFLARFSTVSSEAFVASWQNHLAVMASLTAGTLLLVIVAGLIRQHGLGNGYAALILSGWGFHLIERSAEPTPGDALGLVTLVAIGAATVGLLRMRIGDDRDAALRVPSSGMIPLSTARGIAAAWSLVSLGLIGADSIEAFSYAFHRPWVMIASTLVLAVVWSFAFSRPAIVAPFAARSPLAPPSQASWRRATLVSLVGLTAIVAATLLTLDTAPGAALWCDPLTAMMFAAAMLDVLDDLRARRGDLVVAWPLHQAQHAELVRGVLAQAGIACHLSSSHLRTLLAFFGPYVPIDVLVPAASVDEARSKIGALFGDLPVEAFD